MIALGRGWDKGSEQKWDGQGIGTSKDSMTGQVVGDKKGTSHIIELALCYLRMRRLLTMASKES